MMIKNLNYCQKRKIVMATCATLLLLITIIGCTLLIFLLYGEALFSSKSTQLKKAEEYAAIANQTKKEGVVFVGDSIMELYNLPKYFKDKDYINRGISGNKSQDVLNRLQTNVIDLKPKTVLVHVGTNDIGHAIPEETYLANMDKIIEMLQTNLPDCNIIVNSIFPTVTLDNYNSKNLTKKRDNFTIMDINSKLRHLCNTKKVIYLDIHKSLLLNDKLNKTYTLDGLHLSDVGYKLVTREIYYCFENFLKRN